MTSRVPITFLPDGVTCWVEPGTTVSDAALLAGITVATPCGGRGVCGSCGVRVIEGRLNDPDDAELAGLARAPKGVRLACRATVGAAVAVRPMLRTQRARVAPVKSEAVGERALVAGVDLGTTSVAAVLIDAHSGRELARASVPNRQQVLGADVLSRVSAALAGEAPRLRELAEHSVLDALRSSAEKAGVALSGVQRLVIAGNSAMAALLAGEDTRPLSVPPFAAPTVSRSLSSDSLRVEVGTAAEVLLVPAIASFVGGDALAGALYTRMLSAEKPVLLVDLGTNAEIVLAHQGVLVVTSAAAGPAFEGAGIMCGGPAADGAVVSVAVTPGGDVDLDVLGGGEPLWFSGSGIVSAIAALRRIGHIDPSGLMCADGPLKNRHFVDDAGVVGFRLGSGDGCLTISQLDVRAVQLAKAAIRVGVEAVLRAADIAVSELAEVLVAGAFGFSVQPADLIDLGVMPSEALGLAKRVGNVALDGAAACALDAALLDRAHAVALNARSVELAATAGFNTAFLSAMNLEPYSIG